MAGGSMQDGGNEAARREAAGVSDAAIEDTLLSLVRERTAGGATVGRTKTICPSEVSRALMGADEKRWRLLMKPVRRVAVALAQAGTVELRRKGRAVDPSNFKGIYRIGVAEPAERGPAQPPERTAPEGETDTGPQAGRRQTGP